MVLKKIKVLKHAIVVSLFTILFSVPFHSALAESSYVGTKEQVQHEKAEQLRRQAKANAKANLGYDDVITQNRQYQNDLDYLGYQINRLGKILRQISVELDTQHDRHGKIIPKTPPLITDPKNDSMVYSDSTDQKNQLSIYGPQGPTKKSVQLLIEYRLMVGGNPRLKLGKVEESKETVQANIVTVDDSIVQTYIIDKKTGAWKAVYK